MVERKPRPAGEMELALVAQMRRGGEPTVTDYLEAARKSGVSLEAISKELKATSKQTKGKREQSFRSVQEKQKPKGKPPAREWKVQTGKGGAFVLVHRESGDFYADYVSTPITSWGAKRFVTAADAHRFLNDPKHFNQPARRD